MSDTSRRHLGLFGATGVGVGAIVGGGILALAGVAFAVTGPAAILAFAINGVIALLTALSFAEMASKFSESGGAYTFAKKVLSVEAAFTVGWVVWFASIVAAVLYALGFAHFAIVMAGDLWNAFAGAPPEWLTGSAAKTGLAVLTMLFLAIGLARKAGGGGTLVNIGKVAVFAVLIAGGLWAVARTPAADVGANLAPFFSAGYLGLVQAMGYTFIALQGFDLIAAVGGEVREPERNIPRAMVLSLGIALLIYLPLLFVIVTVGMAEGETVRDAAASNPEGIVAVAAQNYLGPFGYWLVIVAAVLSMFSALQANLFAASRIARAMALDRTLPERLASLHERRSTPIAAIVATCAIVAIALLVLPDVATAGAASSLIFLVTFALAHWVAILVRLRSSLRPPPFRTPLFPAVPVVGGVACVGLAVFQGIAVPAAGMIAVFWLSLGGLMFLALFARRARVLDASSAAYEPELVTLRGRTPLVLVPIANPQNAPAMVALANALVPAQTGRVLTLTVVVAPDAWRPDDDRQPMDRAQTVMQEVLKASTAVGVHVEALTTVAAEPMREIARVARLHRCESVLLGLSNIDDGEHGNPLEPLLGTVDADVVVLRSRLDWQLADAKRILIPVGGYGGHEHLRARLLGSLLRSAEREITFLRVLPSKASDDDVRRAKRSVRQLAEVEVRQRSNIEVIQSDDVVAALKDQADNSDLLIMGVQRIGRHKKLLGSVIPQIARQTSCPLLVISRRG